MASLIFLVVLRLFRQGCLAALAAWVALVPVASLVVIAEVFSWKLNSVTLAIGSLTAKSEGKRWEPDNFGRELRATNKLTELSYDYSIAVIVSTH